MLKRADKPRAAESTDSPRASSSERTKVILMAQLVAIVALIVVWSIVRNRRACSSGATVPPQG